MPGRLRPAKGRGAGTYRGSRPGRWVQRRRKVQLEKQGNERERFFIWASRFHHTPQGQLVSHCLPGPLGSFAERSAWCLSLLVDLAAPFTVPQCRGSCRGCRVSLATGECGVTRQKSSKRALGSSVHGPVQEAQAGSGVWKT